MIKIYKIKGMDCASCATMLEINLEEEGIKCRCSFIKGTLEVDANCDTKKLIEILKKSDYSISGP